ncbi:MAG: serine/threonine protein phosphatase [Alphaproteobacteria bacterium]|nr:serine/threonine protein phosphatase [Alphaproteobacteria bacterium]
MLTRWLGGPKAKPVTRRVPADTRVYAIGDIHGRRDLVRELEAAVLADAGRHPAARRVLVYLGDYVDRGLESKGVIDHLLRPAPTGFERVCLKGNHEDLMLGFLDDPGMAPSWFHNGGLATLYSYGVAVRDGGDAIPGAAVSRALREALPEPHLAFLRGLALHHRIGDFLFVHAGIRPGVAIDQQEPEDLMWIREPFTRSQADHGCVVVHGHTIEAEPVDAGNRIGIDTGAYATGVLTCLVLQGDTRGLLRTGPGT